MKNQAVHWVRFPLYGILSFLILYFPATFLYPGGTKFNAHTVGYSFVDNFWCDLFVESGYNGLYNPGRPFAILAMALLALGLVFFWYTIPYLYWEKIYKVRITRFCGCLSMFFAALVFTEHHDLCINLAGFFGCVAILSMLIGFLEVGERWLVWLGFLNLLLIGICLYMWHTGFGLTALPIIQKFTFLLFFLWVGMGSFRCLLRLRIAQSVEDL